MPDGSRNFLPARARETIPTHSEAGIAFGPSVTADLKHHLEKEVGHEAARCYWNKFEQLREEPGYADYLGALLRYRSENPHVPRLLTVSRFPIDYPFADRLIPNALDVVERVKQWGPAVIPSDGDVVIQPLKVERSGLSNAVASGALIVLTIGHSTRTIEEFIGLLQAHGATRVVDVRTVPRSRHNPQFNEASLPGPLEKAGLGYVHMQGLGGLRHAKHDSLNPGWRNASFRGYADYMQTPEFEQSLDELVRLANQERIVLMCAEAVPWRCHRSLIADALLVRGIRTEDIMGPTRRQVHTLTPFAKVRGTTITYPAEASRSIPEKPSAKRSRPQPIGKTRQTKGTSFTP